MASNNNPSAILDLETYTKIPAKIMNELVKKTALCIGSEIAEAKAAKKDAVVIDIGIGTLSVSISTGDCKFVPSKELRTTIKRCMTDSVDPLELQLSEEMSNKLLFICRENL